MLAAMLRYADIRFARMSSGHRCLIRDLGLVKGGKGLRHHEVVLELSWRGLFRFAASSLNASRSEQEVAGEADASPTLSYRDRAFEA
jgi:hypothetical protein